MYEIIRVWGVGWGDVWGGGYSIFCVLWPGGGGSPRMQDFDGGGARMQDFDFRVSFARPAPCCTLCVFWRRRAPVLECRISTGVLPSAWLVWLSAGCFVQTRSALTQPHKNEHRMVLKPLCEGGEVIF